MQVADLLSNGTPRNLDDCLEKLQKIIDREPESEGWKEFRDLEEDKAVTYQHHGVGRALRNTLLWDANSDIHKWFNEKGIFHADDMSPIILTSFHRKLHNKPIDLEKQIKIYRLLEGVT